MANRDSVIDGQDAPVSDNGLVYSEVLGWIDLGHARGDDVRFLLDKPKRVLYGLLWADYV
ncbi:hypothetical protein [Pantoea alhagi]|uniref:hypothetical protein n=1 Tax=Pantoea alhagi TaxID=1891675 RepID=UPI0030B8EF19